MKNKFTEDELNILRIEAERERAEIKKAGMYMPFSLSEKMLEFAEEMNRGNTWNTPGAKRFAGVIKRHLAGSVKTGTSRRGAKSKKRL